MKSFPEVLIYSIAVLLLTVTLVLLIPPLIYFIGVHIAPTLNEWVRYWRIP